MCVFLFNDLAYGLVRESCIEGCGLGKLEEQVTICFVKLRPDVMSRVKGKLPSFNKILETCQ